MRTPARARVSCSIIPPSVIKGAQVELSWGRERQASIFHTSLVLLCSGGAGAREAVTEEPPSFHLLCNSTVCLHVYSHFPLRVGDVYTPETLELNTCLRLRDSGDHDYNHGNGGP